MAPNWLGDAVMALAAMEAVRRRFASAQLVVAARRGVADLFRLAPFVNHVVTCEWDGRWWHAAQLRADARRLRDDGAEVAVLFPNSFASAWLARHAGIRERWGYASDVRMRLLTRAIRRPGGERHQGEYYLHLVRELGCQTAPPAPCVTVSERAVEAARQLLLARGWNGTRPIVAMAPGAAYGKAKQWIPSYVAQLAADLVQQRGATCVFVGSRKDAADVRVICRALAPDAGGGVINLAGETSLEILAAVFSLAAVCVSNDSGAMHVAAAVATPVVALFGPTRERETTPLARPGARVEVLTHPVWCRPCMLRECPIDHRCMTGIHPQRVLSTIDRVALVESSRRAGLDNPRSIRRAGLYGPPESG
jgi:heptosyltransferase-2